MGVPRLDQALLRKLASRERKSIKYVREQVCKRADKRRVSSAAFLVHWLGGFGIGTAKYRNSLPAEIQAEIRALTNDPSRADAASGVSKRQSVRREVTLQVEGLQMVEKAPLLKRAEIVAASRNASLYPFLYTFENSVRTLVETVLKAHYGADWWTQKVRKEIRDKVAGRIHHERQNPWHGSRSGMLAPISYTDFTELAAILRANAKDFHALFKGLTGGLNWLTQRLDEMAHTRHALAHSAPIVDRDRRRFLDYVDDWYRQLDSVNQKLGK